MEWTKKRLLTPPQLTIAIVLVLLPALMLSVRSRARWRHITSMTGVMKKIPTMEKVAALTFDDGPDGRFTPAILDELKRSKVRATFFLIGEQVQLYPDIARRIVAEGHLVGNHTYTHPQLERMPDRIVDAELISCDEIVARVTGVRPVLFRAPQGDLNRVLLRKAAERGYRVVQWTVCADNKNAPTPQMMAARVLKRACPGMIVLIHDGRVPDRAKDVEALPLIIQGLRDRGYQFVPLSDLWMQ